MFFCLYSHPQLPLSLASIESKRRDKTKDGFELRYIVAISDATQGDHVISLLDDMLGDATRSHGVYQARYENVHAAYKTLLDAAMVPEGINWTPMLQAAAMIAGISLTVAMCVLLPMAVIFWAVISMFKRQGGITAMAETAVVWSIFDWRPIIHKLFHYANTGIWPK